MVLQIGIGCDGTAASDRPGQYRDSNVVKLLRMYADVPLYVPGIGVGQRFKSIRYITGWGASARAREASQKLQDALEQAMSFYGVGEIRVFGVCWSRGHLSLLRAIEKVNATVDALVILDAVSSIGDPIMLNTLDRLYPQEIPSQVVNCLHLVAQHEDTLGFSAKLFPSKTGLHQVLIPGDHTEVGRGTLALEMSGKFLDLQGLKKTCEEPPENGWGQPSRRLAQDLQDYQTWLKNLPS